MRGNWEKRLEKKKSAMKVKCPCAGKQQTDYGFLDDFNAWNYVSISWKKLLELVPSGFAVILGV